MLKKIALMVISAALLLGGCTQLAGSSATAAQTETAQVSALISPLPSPSISETTPIPAPTADIADKMFFSKDDMAEIKSYWPLKKYGIDDFGKFDYADIDQYGKFLEVSFGFDMNKDLDSLYKELKSYLKGKWKKEDYNQYIFSGKAEGREIYCGIFAVDSSTTSMFIRITLNDRYEEALKLIEAHWLPEDMVMAKSLDSPYERDAELDENSIKITYTWSIKNYADVFVWFGDMMEKSGLKRPTTSSRDLVDTINIGSSYGLITLSGKTKTLTVLCELQKEAEF